MAKRVARTTEGAPASILEKYKDFEGIAVIERRLKHPDLPGSLPIRLTDEPAYVEDPTGKKRKWYLRWINGSLEGRTSQVVDGMGYVPVKIAELRNAEGVTGLAKSDDGVVRRGDRGQEWLAKMPLEIYTAIKRAQQEQRDKRNRNAKLLKEDLANAAGSALGSEAGDMIHDEFDVSVTRHKSTYGQEFGEDA